MARSLDTGSGALPVARLAPLRRGMTGWLVGAGFAGSVLAAVKRLAQTGRLHDMARRAW